MNLNQITIPSLNVPQSIAFYKKLGLRLIVHTHDAYARFECTDGDTTFSIHKVEQLAEGPGIYIYFEVKNVAETVANLEKKGIVFDQMATKVGYGRKRN